MASDEAASPSLRGSPAPAGSVLRLMPQPSTEVRPIIMQVQGLMVVFPTGGGDITALEDFSLDIHEGEIVGIVGEAGSGKSTAALAMLGLVRPPGRIAAGEVLFQGENLLGKGDRALRAIRGRDLSLVVQHPHGALNPLLRVGEQIVNMYRAHHKVSRKEAMAHAIAMLKLVGINDPERRIMAFPHELSGGMAQRVLIAMALSSRPKLLVADEPSSGLDVTIQAQVLDEMWEAVRRTGSAILLVSQDLGIIANYCDRVVVMQNKRIVEEAPVVDFFHAPQHEYSKAILALQLRDRSTGQPGQSAVGLQESAPGAVLGLSPGSFATGAQRPSPGVITGLSPDASAKLVAAGGNGFQTETPTAVPNVPKSAPIPVALPGPEPAGALFEVEHLTKHFPLRNSKAFVQAVDDVSFSIRQGETLGLVGESGSGKTTVGRCLLRLIEPTSGEIRFKGIPLSKMPQDKLRSYRASLQIVFQNPFDSLNPRWTVGDTLKEPLDLHHDLSRSDKQARVLELMSLVGLDKSLVNERPRQLSAGKQQRVCIARALATNPAFIVLDEPTSALAPAAHAEIIELLIDLQHKLGLSYLFISHDLSTVKYLCHRVAVMYLSQIVEIGAKDEVFNEPLHPYSRALLSSVLFPDPANRRVDRKVRDALEGEIPSPIDLPKGCYLYGRCPLATPACQEKPQELLPVAGDRLIRCWRVSQGDLDVSE